MTNIPISQFGLHSSLFGKVALVLGRLILHILRLRSRWSHSRSDPGYVNPGIAITPHPGPIVIMYKIIIVIMYVSEFTIDPPELL